MKRDKLIEDIFDILSNDELNNQNTTLSKAALGAIKIGELRLIYSILSQQIIKASVAYKKRPNCPAIHIKQQNKATIGYKDSMIKYISQFGLVLEGHPCNYTPGVLERIANRCELILEK